MLDRVAELLAGAAQRPAQPGAQRQDLRPGWGTQIPRATGFPTDPIWPVDAPAGAASAAPGGAVSDQDMQLLAAAQRPQLMPPANEMQMGGMFGLNQRGLGALSDADMRQFLQSLPAR